MIKENGKERVQPVLPAAFSFSKFSMREKTKNASLAPERPFTFENDLLKLVIGRFVLAGGIRASSFKLGKRTHPTRIY
jgi:hypothetical protein